MPIVTAVVAKRDLTIFTVSGIVEYADFQHAADAYYCNAPTLHTLVDLRQARLQSLDAEMVGRFAQRMQMHASENAAARHNGKAATVAPSELSDTLMRTYERLLGSVSYELRITRSMDEALEWVLV